MIDRLRDRLRAPSRTFAGIAVVYLQVVLLTGAALGLSLLLEPLIEPDFSPLFLGAVALCTGRWGRRAGILSMSLAVPSLLLLYLPPHYTFNPASWAVFFRILSFLSTAVLIVWLVRMFRNAERDLVRSLEEVRTREERFRVALLKSSVVVFHQDADLRYIWAYNPFPEHSGFSLVDKVDSDLFPPDEAELLTRIKRQVLSTGVGLRREVTLTSRDGVRTMDLTIEPFRALGGDIVGLLGTAVDITGRKRIEEQLKDSGERFRSLATHQYFIHENQRALTSREIHDEVTQMLGALELKLESISGLLLDGGDRSSAIERLRTISGALLTTMETSERISADLRPSLLDNLGLAAAVESLAREFESHTGITVAAGRLEMLDLPPEVSTVVFRIVQDALANIEGHAGATRVAIHVRKGFNGLLLRIRDNGKGIAKGEMTSSESLGLLGMRERARSFGGKITVQGRPGAGTRLWIEIPANPALDHGGPSTPSTNPAAIHPAGTAAR